MRAEEPISQDSTSTRVKMHLPGKKNFGTEKHQPNTELRNHYRAKAILPAFFYSLGACLTHKKWEREQKGSSGARCLAVESVLEHRMGRKT